MKWQQIGNRKSVSPNNICNKNKISAKKRQNLNNIFKDIFGLAEIEKISYYVKVNADIIREWIEKI